MKSTKFLSIFLLVESLFLSSCGIGPATRELKKINTSVSRYWLDFIKKNGINAIDGDGDLLLIEAVKSDNFPLANACIKSGADVNRYVQGKFPAIIYALSNDNPDMIKLLVKNKAVIKNDYFDCVNILVKVQDEISRNSMDAILSAVKKNMLDYSNTNGIYYNTYFKKIDSYLNPYLFEKLYEKGYKPSSSDYRRFIYIWYNSENEQIQELAKKIAASCKNTEAAKSVNAVFNENASLTQIIPEERRFEFLKFQVENGADIKENGSDFEDALNHFTNQNNLEYIFNLLKKYDVEIKDSTRENLITSCFAGGDFNKFEFITNHLKERGLDVEIPLRNLSYVVSGHYKNSTHEEFENYISEIDKMTTKNYKDDFISENWTAIETKCGIDSYVSGWVFSSGTSAREHIEEVTGKKFSDIINSVIKEVDWLNSLGFPVENCRAYKYYLTLAVMR